MLFRIVVVLCLFALPHLAEAAPPLKRFIPGMSYYFEHFDPVQRPWNPGPDLNIEEVFKNYQFFEIVVGDDNKEFTVNSFIKGNKASSEKYRLLPDGSLQKNGQP